MESLRASHVQVSHAPRRLEVGGSALEIVVNFAPSRADRFGLAVRCSPDGSEQTLIGYAPATGWLSIDRERSSLDPAVDRESRATRLSLADGETLQLHVFVDHSVVEVYANRQACLTTRIYPSRSDSVGVEVFAAGGVAELQQLDAWELRAIWAKLP